jgi:spermidine synthase
VATGSAAGGVRPPTRIETAVFVSGVASMGLEIVAGRLLAATFGSSIFVWGSVIGVFLTALAVGYWIAGRRAGTHASRGGLATALLLAAGYVALLVVVGEPVLALVSDLGLPARFAPLVPVTLLFGPPTVLLGFVSPYGAELVAARSTGDASGRVYALGTGGSIVGAFGTTFVLVPAVGVPVMEAGFGLLLVATAIWVAPKDAVRTHTGSALVIIALVAGTGVVVAGVGGGDVVQETETPYQHMRIVDDDGVRTMYLNGGPQSAMDLDRPTRYVFGYSSYLHLPMLAVDDPDEVERVLFVGGGGFSSPKRYVAEYPNVTVDVVELDPAVVRAAKEHFRVEESDRFRIHTADGRVFLRDSNRTYDVIVLDAFRSTQVPYHLTTVEFMDLVADRLDDDGVVVANIISSTDGADSAFYRAQVKTLARAFPQVYSFPTRDSTGLQNIELLATMREERLTEAELLARNRNRSIGLDLAAEIRRYTVDVSTGDAPLLTDDYAPVDSLLASQIDQSYVPERIRNDSATTATPPAAVDPAGP